jgi:hypothetical protein
MELILAKKEFSPNTKKVYLSIIKRLTKIGFKYPDKKAEKVEYIKQFFTDNEMTKASTRLDQLNLVIVLRIIQELPIDKLKEFRTELAKERLQNQIPKMNAIKETLISKSAFEEELLKTYEAADYKKFIVNYLMLNFGTRTMDLDVLIVKDAKEATDPKQNYLILKPKKVTWVRNTYKTSRTFGTQEHVITDVEFISAVKNHGLGRLFPAGQLSNGMKKLLINGMLESKIFKMLIDAAYDKKDTAEINRLSKTRGTSIATIRSFYDINAEHEVIRQL